MKKFLKWAAIALGGVVVLALASAFYLVNKYNSGYEKIYTVSPHNISLPSDSASLQKGKRWATALCTSCHGFDFAGKELFRDESIGFLNTPNITPGKGSAVKGYTTEDWVRILSHGVKRDGKSAFVMPSADFCNMAETDEACLIAYMQTIPPVDKEWEPPQFTFMAKVMAGAGLFGNLFPAEKIDHSAPVRTSPAVAVSAEYGDYLVRLIGCRTCHGQQLNGFQDPAPGSPFTPNITPGGRLGKWNDDNFVNTLRSGVTPEGTSLDTKFMPWTSLGQLNDEELKAIYRYLQSVPSLPDTEH